MKLNIRPIKENDYDDTLVGWWKDWGWDVPPKDFLPKNGLIAICDDTPVCAGFLYLSDSSVAWVEWVISNKDFRQEPERSYAIKMLVNTLTLIAEEKGYKYCYALLKHDGLIDTYKEIGYIEGDSYNKEMIKKLCQ